MATVAKNPTLDTPILPDEAEFATTTSAVATPLHPAGFVHGVDPARWATAIVNLKAKPDRIEAERRRITAKGYKRVEGTVRVEGYEAAEVYVIPRHLFDQRRKERAEFQRSDRRYTEFVDGNRGTTAKG